MNSDFLFNQKYLEDGLKEITGSKELALYVMNPGLTSTPSPTQPETEEIIQHFPCTKGTQF